MSLNRRNYQSCFKEYLEMFSDYMRASHHWSSGYDYNILSFDRYCAEQFPDDKCLSQEMIDLWCRKRDTETNLSCHTRQCCIVALVKYLRARGLSNVHGPDRPKKNRSLYVPHAFTDEELCNFFHACDSICYKPGHRRRCDKLKKFTTPVIFRVLYSTGMRTNEARLLARDDVDLEEGIISIKQSKGEQQRYVVIHPTLLPILQRYDRKVAVLCPDRHYFFPSPRGGCLTNTWITDVFREMWDKYNSSHATAYELRHHYAIVNINHWQDMGFELYDHLLYLSKSMGHCSVESTRNYYAIVPALADTLEEKTAKDTDWMLPDIEG